MVFKGGVAAGRMQGHLSPWAGGHVGVAGSEVGWLSACLVGQQPEQQSLEVMFDLFNTLNASTILSMVTTNGPNFLLPTQVASGAVSAAAILPARIFKLGARYRF